MRLLAPLGLFSIVVPALLALPVTSLPSNAPAPHPVQPSTSSLAVTGVDAVALADVGASSDRPHVLTRRTDTKRFTTFGVTWEPGSGSDAVIVTARTRDSRGWSEWEPLELAEDEGPDDVSAEAQGAGLREGTAPAWVGEASGVQVRVDVPSGPAPRDVRVELVDPGTSAADASLGQRSQPRSTATAATRQPTIISRAQWGADESIRGEASTYASSVKVAYVHHTASTNDYTADQAAAQVRSFYAYHVNSLGWSDIGYNFLVDKFGRIYEGRHGGITRAVIGAHAGGFNTATVGVSMIGNHSTVAPSSATITSVRDLLAWKLSLHGVDPLGKSVLTSGGGSTARYPAGTDVTVNNISGHRDTNSTACPGDGAYSKLPALRTSVSSLVQAPVTSPIDAKHAQLGGSTGLLGAATALETAASTGRRRTYQRGDIYWSSATGAFEVHGGIRDRWTIWGREAGVLGFPTTDESPAADGTGRYNHFQGGSIYWSPSTGPHQVGGAIRLLWSQQGWEKGSLGYPLTDETRAPDRAGAYNHFQRGSVYWSPTTGAHEVYGAIRERWAALGWERSPLGYPTSGEYAVPGGRRSDFQRGSITWTAATGAVTVR